MDPALDEQEAQRRRTREAVYEPREIARRVRAARAYAKISRKTLAERLGVSASDIRRWEEADNTKRRLSAPQRRRFLHDVAEACEVARTWIAFPFVSTAELSEAERLQERITDLSAEARSARGDAVDAALGELAS